MAVEDQPRPCIGRSVKGIGVSVERRLFIRFRPELTCLLDQRAPPGKWCS